MSYKYKEIDNYWKVENHLGSQKRGAYDMYEFTSILFSITVLMLKLGGKIQFLPQSETYFCDYKGATPLLKCTHSQFLASHFIKQVARYFRGIFSIPFVVFGTFFL